MLQMTWIKYVIGRYRRRWVGALGMRWLPDDVTFRSQANTDEDFSQLIFRIILVLSQHGIDHWWMTGSGNQSMYIYAYDCTQLYTSFWYKKIPAYNCQNCIIHGISGNEKINSRTNLRLNHISSPSVHHTHQNNEEHYDNYHSQKSYQ